MRTLILVSVLLTLVCSGCWLLEDRPPEDTGPAETATPTPTPRPVKIGRQSSESAETISRSYEWRYGGRLWTLTLDVPEALYDYYKERARPPTKDYSVYVTHPGDDSYLQLLATEMERAAAIRELDELETVNLAVSFVQSLPYTSDSVTTPYDEYPRYPVETLVDNGGDCEDTSILLAALLDEMGYDVVLLSPPDHMGVGVLGSEMVSGAYWEHRGGRYFYVETTGEGWGFGEIPEEYRSESAHIYDIIPVAVLTHEWNATTRYYRDVKLNVTAENLGTAKAINVYVLAGFDAGGGKVWNPEESARFDLRPGEKESIIVNLTAPRDEHTRLVVQIVHDGYAVDESYSEWFDT
jgi:predicted transglutaminase-like cysteine proteinase